MRKLLLISVVLASILIPAVAGRSGNPVKSLKKAVLLVIVFNFFYLLALQFVFPHIE